jgi:hypothetical protein
LAGATTTSPKEVFKDLDKIRRRFLWAGDKAKSTGRKQPFLATWADLVYLTWRNSLVPFD